MKSKYIFFSGTTAIIVGLMLFLFCGCVKNQPHKPDAGQIQSDDNEFAKWQDKAKISKPYLPARHLAPPTSQITKNQPPVKSAKKTSADLLKSLPDTKISIRFINDDLATVLRTMAHLAGENIMISPNVKGTVVMEINDTPWNQVFMGITDNFGLSVIRKGSVLNIMSMGDLKKQVERKSLEMAKEQVSPLTTRIFPIEFSDPEDTAKSIEQLLSKDKDGKVRGSVSVDSHSRSLIVMDTSDNLAKLAKMIFDIDKPTPQILIEAQIIETSKDTARELGIQWGALSKPGIFGGANARITPGTASATTYDQATGLLSYPLDTTMGNNIDLGASTINDTAPATIGLLINSGDMLLSAQLSALQRDGKLNILSSPSIATLDNSEAIIESGRDVPFQTTSGSASGETTVEYKSATLRLKVTPHVISSNMIKLKIDAKKDEVDTKTNAVNGYPYIIKKLAQTQLIIADGNTVVIGGLDRETKSDVNTGVPWLKDLPFLGNLFKKKSTSREFEKLLIFITPKILTSKAGV